jgi:CBS domain-containing protein
MTQTAVLAGPASTVASVMTRDPVAVAPHTPFKDILALMAGHAISAVPVLSATGRVIGVVSEVDLLRARRRRRDTGRLTAVELMTSPAVTIPPQCPLAEATRRLTDSGLRRLFVVDGDRLVGMLARRDVLSVFRRPDKEILADIVHDILDQAGPPAQAVLVSVDAGIVQLTGRPQAPLDLDALVARIAEVPGVIDIKERTR